MKGSNELTITKGGTVAGDTVIGAIKTIGGRDVTLGNSWYG